MTRIMGTLQEGVCTFMTLSCWILFRMRNVQTKVVEKIMFSNIFPKIMPFKRECAKCGTAKQATDGNIKMHRTDMIFMPDN